VEHVLRIGEKRVTEVVLDYSGGGWRGTRVQADQKEDGKMKLLRRKRHGTRIPKENGKMDLFERIQVHKDPK
jgi:hypothetical protein